MKYSTAARWTFEITCALLILLFVYTAISKLADKKTFEIVMSKSPLIGKFAVELSYLVPLIELIIAFLLLFPSSKIAGLWASFILMFLFTGYIAYMVVFTPQLPCSCGGVIKQLSWRDHLLFNTLFIILPAITIRLYSRQKRFIAINRNSRTPV